MILETFHYIKNKGWSISKFPELDSENTLIFVFAASEYIDNPSPIKELFKHYPNSKIIGCSTSGEIIDDKILDHSLSVAVIKFEKTQIKIATVDITNAEESFEAGKTLAHELDTNHLSSIFVLSEGLSINGSELAKGLNSINKKKVIITGGLAGDGRQFKKTWIIVNDTVSTNKIAAIGLYGNAIQIGHGSKGGWDIFGVERRITKSKNNVLFELDQKPALALYKEYLGDKASGLPATGLLFPLAIRKDINTKKKLVRTILNVDEKKGSLTFAGDMPMGYLAQLMRANFDRLITGATEAGTAALLTGHIKPDLPVLNIAVSCVGRRLLLGERTQEEIESVLELFPAGTKQIGFYSYGELSPYSTGSCDLHNQTMTLTSIYEDVSLGK